MTKIKTGRAAVLFPYQSKTTGKTYTSIILGLERSSGKYALPGGTFDASKDKDTLDTALRELDEELDLGTPTSHAIKWYTFSGNTCEHDVYFVQPIGKLKIKRRPGNRDSELKGIGFWNAGRHNQIPADLLERHVKALLCSFRTYNPNIEWGPQADFIEGVLEKSPGIRVKIPGYYFIGNNDASLVDWVSQRHKWRKKK